MPKNFVIHTLLEVNTTTGASRRKSTGFANQCDMCSELKNKDESATLYCTYCQQKLCSSCANYHKKQKFAKSHKIVAIESDDYHNMNMTKMAAASLCGMHPEKGLELYCLDCKSAVCVICFVENHKLHDCANIDKVANNFCERLNADIVRLAEQIPVIKKRGEELANEKVEFEKCIQAVQSSIVMKGKEIKSVVDSHVAFLLHELASIKSYKLNDLEIALHDLEQERAMMESVKECTEELTKNGTNSEIASVANDLHAMVNKLLDEQDAENDITMIDVMFAATEMKNLLTVSGGNVVGQLGTRDKHPSGLKIKFNFNLNITYFIQI